MSQLQSAKYYLGMRYLGGGGYYLRKLSAVSSDWLVLEQSDVFMRMKEGNSIRGIHRGLR